ncbi:unnamed protein product (mitochondrion) [Plasmodiophora brassicae]|uniref:HECT domain-containing protein n=1 Tax=Plasmodiophora brassicae TaxID=37360 RepID=A0A3P3Y5B9_PLABS|nr:unnamed protein product [Plasmodiophora brassicae]
MRPALHRSLVAPETTRRANMAAHTDFSKSGGAVSSIAGHWHPCECWFQAMGGVRVARARPFWTSPWVIFVGTTAIITISAVATFVAVVVLPSSEYVDDAAPVTESIRHFCRRRDVASPPEPLHKRRLPMPLRVIAASTALIAAASLASSVLLTKLRPPSMPSRPTSYTRHLPTPAGRMPTASPWRPPAPADITKTFIDEAAVRRRSMTLKDGDIFWSGIPGDCLAFLEELDRGNIRNSVKYTIVGADADDQGGVMASFITDVAEQVFKQNTLLVGHVQGDQTNLVVFPSPAALDAGPGDVDVEKAMMRIGRLLAFVRGQNHLRQEDYYRKSTNGLAAIPVQLITFRLPVEIRFDLFRAVVDGTDEVADIGLGTFLQRERDRIERSGHPSKTVGEFRQKLAELYMDDILPNVDDIDAFDAYEKVLSKRLVRSWAMQRVRDGYNSQMGLRRYPYRRSWFDPETGLVYKDMFGLMKYSNSDIIRLLQYGERDDSGVFRVALDNRLGQYKALLEAVISKFTEEQCVLFVLALTGQKVLPNHKVRVNCMVPEGLGTRSIFPHSCDYRLDMTFPPTWGSTHRDRVDQLLFSFKEMFLSNTYHAFGKR